jgi:hypothetical protein
MRNEVLCKLLCHNLVQLVQAIYMFGADVNSATKPGPVSKMILKFPF